MLLDIGFELRIGSSEGISLAGTTTRSQWMVSHLRDTCTSAERVLEWETAETQVDEADSADLHTLERAAHYCPPTFTSSPFGAMEENKN